MSNKFLQVDKSLFGSGLTPIEILVLSQIAEFNRTTGDCFMSNAAMAKSFGVSEKTIARTMDSLESKGLIVRNTKNVQKGKERHITLAKDNLSLGNESAKDKMSLPERTNCPLPKGQNDTIKDNIIKEKEKDNIGIDNSAPLRSAELSIQEPAQEEREEEEQYQRVSKREMLSLGVPYEIVDEAKSLYKILATKKIVRAV